MRTIIVLEVEHDKPVPDLANHAAQRIYTMDAVSNVTVLADANVNLYRAVDGDKAQGK